MLEKVIQKLAERGEIEDEYVISMIKSLLQNYSEEYILDNWNELINFPDLPEYKNTAISTLRKITSQYIQEYVPDYRQINFTSAKVNALFILLYENNQTVKDNVKAILLQIRDLEKWITAVIAKFYTLAAQIADASDKESVKQIVDNARSEYDRIPKPSQLESRNIAYIQQLWFNLAL